MIDLGSLLHAVMVLIVAGVVCYLIWWLIGYCGIPEPFNKVARVIVAVAAVFICIAVLMSLVGGVPVFR